MAYFLEGPKWGDPAYGTPAVVTWSFADYNFEPELAQTYAEYPDFEATIGEVFRDYVRAAFSAWDVVANVDFIEVADSVSSDIRLGELTIDGSSAGPSTLGIAFYYWDGNNSFLTAAIAFDIDAFYSYETFYWTAVHEIGHAIGVAHADNPHDVMYPFLSDANAFGALTSEDQAAVLTLYGAEPQAVATAGDDYLRGTEGDDVLRGLDGHDRLEVLAGNDIVSGDSGNDALFGGAGNDQMDGGPGNDFMQGNEGFDTLYGGSGSGGDIVLGGRGDDIVHGGDGDDLANGNIGRDTVLGGEDNDSIRGGQDDDVLNGGPGHDVLYGDLGSDALSGGPGQDAMFGGNGSDMFFFGAAADSLIDSPDRIYDFDGSGGGAFQDYLDLPIAGTSATFTNTGAHTATYSDAQAWADLSMDGEVGGTVMYAAVGSGDSSYLFWDSDRNGTADGAIRLLGTPLADLDVADLI